MKRHLAAIFTLLFVVAALLIWAGLAHTLGIPLCDPAIPLEECTP